MHSVLRTVQSCSQPELSKSAEACDMQMWLIPADSAAYDYTIPDDDIFYIMATSGIYANQSDAFDDLTTNWIGM